MILRAVERGFPNRIAEALGLITDIMRQKDCWMGSAPTLSSFSRTRLPGRHARRFDAWPPAPVGGGTMVGQNNFTAGFAKAILAATPDAGRSTQEEAGWRPISHD